MDTLEELQKKQNAVSWPSDRLHHYLTHLDKPDVIDRVNATNVLCVYACLYSSSVTQRERETDPCYWDQSSDLHGTGSHTQVSASALVRGHVFVCVYVDTSYAVPPLNPRSPSTSCLHAGVMLNVPAFLWSFEPCYFYLLTLTGYVFALCNLPCPSFILKTM